MQQQSSSPPRKKPKLNLSGWLNLYKPVGMSSMQATAKARFLLNAAKAGHAGTLDPDAEGVLPIAFGEATKLIPLLHNARKAYEFTIRWGQQTNTDDAEGDIIATHAHRPTQADILAILPRFIGNIAQVPPAFSAVKINGQRAYAVARAGGDVVLAARQVQIDDLSLIDMPDSDHANLVVTCGTGTYVRSLARDLAKELGTVAHCIRIFRSFVGPFAANTTISLDKLQEMPYESAPELLWPLIQGLDDIPALAVTDTEAQRLQSGQEIRFLSRMDVDRLPHVAPDQPLLAMHHDRVIAICTVENVTVRPMRVLNT